MKLPPSTPRGWANLGQAVLRERKARGFTQPDLAEKASVSSRTLGTLERGDKISESNAKLIAEALGWEASWVPLMVREHISEMSADAVLHMTGEVVETVSNFYDSLAEQHPVGLGLDAAADGLTPEEIEPVLAIVRAIKRAKGLTPE